MQRVPNHKFKISETLVFETNQLDYNTIQYNVCSGSVVVTAYDFESGRPGSNPEWGLIYY